MRLYRYLLVVLLPLLFLVWSPGRAEAYPWMIKHEYNNCASCHVDPSGAGLLSLYGRAQSAILLSSNYGKTVEDPGKFPMFLFGAIPLPEDPDKGSLNLGAFVREGYLWNSVSGSLVDRRSLFMQQEFDGHFQYKAFHLYGALGYAPYVSDSYAHYTYLTHDVPTNAPGHDRTPFDHFTPGNATAPLYWAGFDLSDQVLLRVGRMNLPFGLRNPEHTSFVRMSTRTDYNQGQQTGVSVSFNNDKFRAELMGIAGNYQINPDAYRERGYSGYLEYNFMPHYAVGVSSLVTYADADIVGSPVHTLRQSHGLFTRFSPVKPFSVLGEVDYVGKSPKGGDSVGGIVAFLQPDVEVVQGVHVTATGEIAGKNEVGNATTEFGAWLGAAWYIYSHFDVRFDAIRYMYASPPSPQTTPPAQMTYLLQGHMYL